VFIDSKTSLNRDVGGRGRLRNRRGRSGVCGCPTTYGPPTSLPPSTDLNDRLRPTAHVGGAHRSPQGDSTRDDPQLALYWFEQERLRYARAADRAW
jgi:hypothetical protein